MDDLDKDISGILGINPQVFDAASSEPDLAPRRRPNRRLTVSAVAAVSITALFALTIAVMRPAPATRPAAPARTLAVRTAAIPAAQTRATTRRLDMFVDRQATEKTPQSSVADDQGVEPATVAARGKMEEQTARATETARQARPRHKNHGLNDRLQVARADPAKAKGRPALSADVAAVDLPGNTRTASRNEAQKTLVEDRLEAIDAIRLLRQR